MSQGIHLEREVSKEVKDENTNAFDQPTAGLVSNCYCCGNHHRSAL